MVPTLVMAQSPAGVVRGRVVTAEDGRPIQTALVRILNQHGSETTHADGRFLIAGVPTGTHRIMVSAIGYRAYSAVVAVRAADTVDLAIVLPESVLQLEEIVTVGGVGARAQSDALSPTSVVSAAALDRQLDGTVAASLRHQPGVASGGISPSTAQPVIRGLSGDRVVMLQDGIRAGDLASTSADHAITVDPLTAQRIEVVRGPMSLLYGSSALGGVVNVVREEIPATLPDALHGTISAQASSVNRGAALGGFATRAFGRRVTGRIEGTFRGAGDTRTPAGPLVNTGVSTVDVAAGASWIGERGHAGVSYRFYDTDYGIPGGFVGGHPTGVDIAMQRHSIRSTAERHPAAGRWESLRADAAVTFYRHTEAEPSGAVGTRFRQDFATVNLTARHRRFLGAKSGAIGFAGQFRDIETGGTLRTPSTRDFSVAGFVIQEFGTGPIRIQAGVRYDVARYEPRRITTISVGADRVSTVPRTFGSFSASFGGLADLGGGFKAGGSIARAYRTPDFNELYSNGPHLASNSYDVGDPRLTAEAGLGIDGFVRLERSGVRAEVAGFRNRLSNYIFPSSRGRAVIGRQGGRPLFQFTNEAARFTGAEGTVEIVLARRLAFEATASYVAAVFTKVRAAIPVISSDPPDTTFVPAASEPPLIPPAFGTAELRYETPNVFAGAGARWAARQARVGDFETPTAGYVVGDLHAGFRTLIGGQFHTFTLRVDNVGNKQYRDHLSRIKEIAPQPGRNVSLLYRITF